VAGQLYPTILVYKVSCNRDALITHFYDDEDGWTDTELSAAIPRCRAHLRTQQSVLRTPNKTGLLPTVQTIRTVKPINKTALVPPSLTLGHSQTITALKTVGQHASQCRDFAILRVRRNDAEMSISELGWPRQRSPRQPLPVATRRAGNGRIEYAAFDR